MSEILEKDRDIPFPHFAVLKASAGSGKTHTLTLRIVQFLLSDKIPGSSLRNVLAITFSNNAAREMKERTLGWLKAVSFGDDEKTSELARLVSLDREEMQRRAGLLVEEILDNYPDFQVRTIDSFMTTVFRSSAIDFGYSPEFDILMSIDQVMAYSFDLFLRTVKEGTKEAELMEKIVSLISAQKRKDAAYLWDPSEVLLKETIKIYRKLAATGKRPVIEDLSEEMIELCKDMQEAIEDIEKEVVESGLERRSNSAYVSVLPLVRDRRFADLLGKGLKNPPVKKPGRGKPDSAFERIAGLWKDFSELVRRYTAFNVRSCYTPYLQAYEGFRRIVEEVKRSRSKVFIEDINWRLSEYLDAQVVPDIYFRMGDTIFHFLIDEFQDTSPVQWRNLFPLIENALSQRGSAFVVGDTKQAIYGFRNADYTIMKRLEEKNPFPSAEHIVEELKTNYRSLNRILEFNEKVFKEIVTVKEEYRSAAERSGLTAYVQKVKEGRDSPGYSEVTVLERDDDSPPERKRLQDLVGELCSRGYRYGDIAVLTPRNEDAVRATVWLNERDVPFISYSSLDIRRRRITGELVALLNFLDSPTDDLSFVTFITGDIFLGALGPESAGVDGETLRNFIFSHREAPPLYKAFQKEFVSLWREYFSDLFRSAGYFPLYDLVSQIYSVFRVYETLEEEEATLAKILEVVKDFEGEGYNSLRDFLEFALEGDSGEALWNMDVPRDINAVKVMTVHKAKGLGFPVVIMLLYEERPRGFDYIVQEDEEGVRLLRITRETSESDPEFVSLYEEESIKERVNRLNSLYVGFTRPESELYVIGVTAGRRDYPLDILPEQAYPPSGKPERKARPVARTGPDCEIRHHHRRIVFPAGPEDMLNLEERRRGEFVHRVLALVDYAESELPLAQRIRRVLDETGAGYDEGEMVSLLGGLIGSSGMNEYFIRKSGRTVMLEQEFSDRDGRLFRMDRIVIDPGVVTVIDYKTGKDRGKEEGYAAQVNTYMRILGRIYPGRKVEGIIAYVDAGEVRRIS